MPRTGTACYAERSFLLTNAWESQTHSVLAGREEKGQTAAYAYATEMKVRALDAETGSGDGCAEFVLLGEKGATRVEAWVNA